MSDRFEVDESQLPDIIKGLADRARDTNGLADDARKLQSTVQGLSCSGAGGNVSLAVNWIQHATDGFFTLERDVALRAMLIARYEHNTDLEKKIEDSIKPPKKGGGILGWIHTGLDAAGWLPVIGNAASGLNGLIYLGQGDFMDAALNGLSILPFGKIGAKGIKILKGLKDLRGASRVLHEFEALDQALKGVEHLKPSDIPPGPPGSPEHMAWAWPRSQAGGGELSYDRWKANYLNPINTKQMMDEYASVLGWPDREKTVTTPSGQKIRLDVADVARKRAVEHKSGYQRLTPQNASEIERYKELVGDGWNIAWSFELEPGVRRPAKSLLDALHKAGIPYVIEPEDLPPPELPH